MAGLTIKGGKIVTPLAELDGASIVIEGKTIVAVGDDVRSVGKVLDATEKIVAPGFIDLHIHGAGGYDVMLGDFEGLSKELVKYGVTAYLPTTVALSWDAIADVLSAFEKTQQRDINGAQPLGLHLEGPFLSPEKCGVQPPQYIQIPNLTDYKLIEDYPSLVKIMTVAPEIKGARELINFLKVQGVVVSIGHSNATYGQAKVAIDWGVSHCTHLFNGMRGFHHREPGVIGAVLEDERVTCEIIADGVHVHPAAIKLAVKLKGIDKMVLITDGILAIGLEAGEYELGGQKVIVKGGQARLEDGTLAGSLLTMDGAVRNIMEFAGVNLCEAVRMGGYNPARVLGMSDKKGEIAAGKDADLVILDKDLRVQCTIVEGETVWKASKWC